MTPEELYKRANTEMTMRYESGIRCMEDARTMESVRFFRDFSQGEIDGISDFGMDMYLALMFNHDSTDLAGEERTYLNFCNRIRERASDLKNLLSDYAVRFL